MRFIHKMVNAMINFDLQEKIDAGLEKAKKRISMRAEFVNPGESVAGIYRGITDYPKRQFTTTAIILEKVDGSYVTFPLNDYVRNQLEVQGAVEDRSVVTIYNNGPVETPFGHSYFNLTVVVGPWD